MAEGKYLIIAVAVILFFGVLMNMMVSDFIDIEEQTEDSWIEDIGVVQVTGYTIDIFKFVISTPVWITESVGDFFDGDETPVITLSGTGEHDTETITGNISLDGNYEFIENYNPDGVDEVYEEVIWTTIISWDTAEIRVNKTNDSVSKAWLVLDSQGTDYSDRIYEPTDINRTDWYENWTLVNESYDWNKYIDGTASRLEPTTPTSATEKVQDFFDQVKEQIQNSVRILGLIPNWLGIPVFIILLISILIAIIRLLPLT